MCHEDEGHDLELGEDDYKIEGFGFCILKSLEGIKRS